MSSAPTLDGPISLQAGADFAAEATSSLSAQPHPASHTPTSRSSPLGASSTQATSPAGVHPHEPTSLFVLPPHTHAGRNPEGLVQSSRKSKEVKMLSNAQKATKKVLQETKRAQESYFTEQFDIFLEKQFLDLSAFAEKHDKKIEHLQKLIITSSHYKNKRAVNLENAKLHAKSLEVNADRAPGNCAKLSELRLLVKDDPALNNLSEDSMKLLKDGLLASRDVKKTGARPSNKACSLDYRAEVRELNDRVSSFDVVSCSG